MDGQPSVKICNLVFCTNCKQC